MIFKLWRELTHLSPHEHLPRLPHHLVNEYAHSEIDDDQALILMAGWARDPVGANKVMEKFGVESALQLELKRKRPRADKRERLMNWLRRLEGSTPTEQVISRYLKDKTAPKMIRGIYQTQLEDKS